MVRSFIFCRGVTNMPGHLLCLWQQDDQFQLRIREIARHIRGEIAGSHDGLPCGPSLAEAEVLVVELNRNRGGRRGHVPEWNSRERMPDEMFQMSSRTRFDELRSFCNQLGFRYLRAHRQ